MKAFLFLIVLLSYENGFAYEVKKNDSLSVICKRERLGEIYGPSGCVGKVIRLNPAITNPHFIRPGQSLVLPVEVTQTTRNLAQDIPLSEPEEAPGVVATEVIPEQPTKLIEVAPPVAAEPSPRAPGPEDAPLTSVLRVSAGTEYFAIRAEDRTNGSSARLISNSSPRLDLKYALEWSSDFSTEVFFSQVREDIQEDSKSGKTTSNRSGNRTSFGVGVTQRFTESLRGSFFLGRSMRSFVRSKNSATELTIDRVSSVELGPELSFSLLRRRNAELLARARVSWLGPSSDPGYTVSSGTAGVGSLLMRHRLKRIELNAEFYVSQWRQDSVLVREVSTQYGLLMGAAWRFND